MTDRGPATSGASPGFREAANALRAARTGAGWSESFGPGRDVRTVGGRMFAVIGVAGAGVPVETPDVETAGMPIDAGLRRRAWVRLSRTVAEDEPRRRIAASYDILRTDLTRRAQAALRAIEAG